jgi:hypothetical protein
VHVTGDSIATSLRFVGMTVLDGPLEQVDRIDAVFADLRSPGDALRFCRLAGGCDAPLVAVAVCGGRRSPRERTARVWRALELATMPLLALRASVAARRITDEFNRVERITDVLPTGDRSQTHQLGLSRSRPPVGAVISGWRGERASTVLDEAVAAASAAIGSPLTSLGAAMTDSGKLLVRVSDDQGRRFHLRLAGGAGGREIHTIGGTTRKLTEPGVPATVRERVVAPVALGTVDDFYYSLEPQAVGTHPRQVTAALWEDCLEFLIALFRVGRTPSPDQEIVSRMLARHVQLVAPVLSEEARQILDRVTRSLTERLRDVPLGWAHGDFWPENLFVQAGRLTAIIDWDDVGGGRLPLLDLLDLRGVSDRGRRFLPPGPRLTKVLLPLARNGGDEWTRRYCRATGISSDPETLEALSVAWWLQRVAHDLRDCSDKLSKRRWLEENVAAPLAALDDP